MSPFRTTFVLLIVMLAAGLCACASRGPAAAPLQWSQTEKRIVVFPPDVKLGRITIGGTVEPQDGWTQTARTLLLANLARKLGTKGITAVRPEELNDPGDAEIARQYSFWEQLKLDPEKGLPDTHGVRDRYRADYALSFYLRDNYTSAGRNVAQGVSTAADVVGAAATIASGGLLLVPIGLLSNAWHVPGANRSAQASLIDLRTGSVVWIKAWNDTSGDLREDEDSREFVDKVLEGVF
jgi:hypothetical protein